MYDLSVSVFKKKLSILFSILKRTGEQLAERNIDSEEILKSQLAPDMWNFKRQVQATTDFIKNGVFRLAGQQLKLFQDDEESLEELQTRLIKTISYLNQIQPDQINGSESKIIKIKIQKQYFEFQGFDFLQNYVTPNVYFHLSITYAILRANNIDIGKADYLGSHVSNKRKVNDDWYRSGKENMSIYRKDSIKQLI